MTPEEIQRNPDSDALIFWLKEIAYQLAVMNERNAPPANNVVWPGTTTSMQPGETFEVKITSVGTEEPIHDCRWHTSPEPVDDRCRGVAFRLNTSAYEFPPCIHMPMGGRVQCAVCYKMKGHA
jgi:hypothetical protein